MIGAGISAATIHNARGKRAIIEKQLSQQGTTHHTRKSGVTGSMAFSSIIRVLTFGVAVTGI